MSHEESDPITPEKRAHILASAREEFVRVGFAHAAVADIASRADVSTATLYKAYRSKEEIFVAAVEDQIDLLDRSDNECSCHQTMDARDALQCTLEKWYDDSDLFDSAKLVRSVIGAAKDMPDLARQIHDEYYFPRRRYLAGILDVLVERGELRQHDTLRGARLLLGMMNEHVYWRNLVTGTSDRLANRNAVLAEAVELYVARYGAKEEKERLA